MIKSKNNDCGTPPGNLVVTILSHIRKQVVKQLTHKQRKMPGFQPDEAKLNMEIRRELESLTPLTLGMEKKKTLHIIHIWVTQYI